MNKTKYVVGIDLGTSNTVVSYAEVPENPKTSTPTIQAFDIPQLASPGDVQLRRLLPSAMYIPGPEISTDDIQLPWSNTENTSDLSFIGYLARKMGGKVPIRLIESSKSWLCHGGVHRTGKILPWHGPEEIKKFSPVDIAQKILRHIRLAWNHQIAQDTEDHKLENQNVLITIPASFDEAARQMTLDAAKKAGLVSIHLLEEPLAAFYAYIRRTGGTPQTTGLKPGQRIVIADVGGGTTDFTLIEVKPNPETTSPEQAQSQPLHFDRTAVGEHLLLGGDNMDLALAYKLEPQISSGKKLDSESWAQLKFECRQAKETLFEHPEQTVLNLTIAGRGRRLLGGAKKAKLNRDTLNDVVLEGYFPYLPLGEKAKPQTKRQSGITEYGLPYATDPRITSHLAAFLLKHGPTTGERPVDAILFNGGALKPPSIRERICDIIGDWMRKSTPGQADTPNPRPLIWDEGDEALELSVANGATYFGLVKLGLGRRIGDGAPREYFLGLDVGSESKQTNTEEVKVVCIAPRGMHDGQTIEIPNQEFQITTNKPVKFPLFASTAPRNDELGSILKINKEELHELPPLETVIKFGKQKTGTQVPIRIQVHRTEVGTLEISCLSKMSGARFKLAFDLRSAAPTAASVPEQINPSEQIEVPDERVEIALKNIKQTFAPSEPPGLPPNKLMRQLEEDLELSKNNFPLITIRKLAEHLLELLEHKSKSPEIETRWLNLTGFCLRPGFGVALDDWRVKQLWKIHAPGPHYPSSDDVNLNWWILWRRVAGGLSRGPQEELAARLMPMLISSMHKRARKKPPKSQSQEATEMWRTAASLERISAKQRAQFGQELLELIESRKAPKGALWCLGRIGARQLLYGPRESIIKSSVVEQWIDRLLKVKKLPKGEPITEAIVSLARLTGDRQNDVSEPIRQQVDQTLSEMGVAIEHRNPVINLVKMDRDAQISAFGENLPMGLSILE